jgi:mRNA-degrading endonuclease RelE of RelBE toxin-antitoxin system
MWQKEKQNHFKICLMKFETVSLFEKQFKKLAKKYSLIKEDVSKFITDFDTLHSQSTTIKNNLFKTRLANSNKNKGKSSGYRIYYYLKINDTVYLLTIYDKSEIESINEFILDEFIDEIIKE